MRNNIIIIIIISVIISLSGCSSSEFDSEYSKFKISYLKASNFMEEENDSLNAIRKLDIDMVESELMSMKTSMSIIKNLLNTKTEKAIYGNLENYYKDLEFLVKSAKNIELLTIEEKRKVYIKALSVISNRKSIVQETNK